jgi:cell division protein FtsI/penicillin-binding protein 2
VEKIVSQSGEIVKEFKPELIKKIEISQETFRIIKEGMRRVVESGTGRLANIEVAKVAGKTGTAQNPQGENHAWFIGFAPYDKPEICVTVLVENGGDGSAAAAPIAAEIIRKYFQPEYEEMVKVENI